MYNSVIKLISQTYTVDDYGDTVTTEEAKMVFAELKSITQSEFYQAGANGLKPEIKFVLADYYDYAGQKFVRYQPWGESTEQDYTVLRTYRNGNEMELVCKRGVD